MRFLLLMQLISLRSVVGNRSLFRSASKMNFGHRTLAEKLDTPELGDRIYNQFILKNGIPVTLVHDKTSLKSSCSLSVKIGASADPLPGIAHITEHAVFLGSKKYPVENEYKSFLNKNGGSSNAGTGMEHTTYQFDVNSGSFTHALDLFSQFFKSPLFDHNAMSREIMAVDSEDSKNRIIDARRLLQVLKNQMVPSSSYTKFSTGNLKTLVYGDLDKYSLNLTNTIRTFHSAHYRPENMAVCMVGPQTVDEMKRLAEEMFSDIQSVDSGISVTTNSAGSIGDKIISSSELTVRQSSIFTHPNKLIRIRPVKDLRDLSLLWELPPTVLQYASNPANLFGFLLSHKGQGSLFAALQDRGWVTSTSAGLRTEYEDFSLFQVNVALTVEGLEHYEEIVSSVHKYIAQISELSDEQLQSYWREIRQCNELEFRFQEKASPYELCSHVATNMIQYPLNHVLSAGYLLDESVNVHQVRDYLSRLRTDNSQLFLRSSSFDTLLQKDDVTHLDGLLDIVYAPYSGDHGSDDNAAKLEALKQSGELFATLRNAQKVEQISRQQVASSHVTCIEPYYGVPYTVEDRVNEAEHSAEHNQRVSALMSSIHMPLANDFIVASLSAVSAPETLVLKHTGDEADSDSIQQCNIVPPVQRIRSTPPVQLESESSRGSSVWVSRDEMFRQPRSVAHVLLHTDSCADSHPSLSLITAAFNQIAARKYYQSALAGLNYQLSLSHRGPSLAFYGFSPKLPALAATVSADLGSEAFWAGVDEQLFGIVKERHMRNVKSWFKERPDSQASTLLTYLMNEHSQLPEDMLALTEATTLSDFRQRLKEAFQYSHITTYSHGDVTANDALKMHSAVKDNIVSTVKSNGNDNKDVLDKARLLPVREHAVLVVSAFNSEDPNSALITHFQGDPHTPRSSALLLVLRRLLSEPAFTELRTKQQLGYIVSLGVGGFGSGHDSVRGLTVRILSKRFSPLHMESSLGTFLSTQQSVLKALTQTEISSLCESLIKSLLDPPTTYTEESSTYWSALLNHMPFDWTQQVVDELKNVTVEDVIHTADKILFDHNSRKSVSVMLFGNAHRDELKKMQMKNEQSEISVEGELKTSSGSVDEEVVEGAFFRPEDRKVLFSLEELTGFRNALKLSGQGDGAKK